MTKKEKIAKQKILLRKRAINTIPILKHENKTRVYFEAIIASTAICETASENQYTKFTVNCLNEVKNKYQKTAIPIYHNFDFDTKECLIGSAMIEGIENRKNQAESIYLLKAKLTIIADPEYVNKIAERTLVPSIGYIVQSAISKSIIVNKQQRDVRVETKIELSCVGIIPKEKAVDPNAKVISMLKDADVEKRLSE